MCILCTLIFTRTTHTYIPCMLTTLVHIPTHISTHTPTYTHTPQKQAAGRVTLSGTISPAVGNLTALRYFNIQNNGRALTGPLPDTMTSLQNLTTILASNNGLNGTLPAWLPKLSSLQFLYLANNSFTGSIPPVCGFLYCVLRIVYCVLFFVVCVVCFFGVLCIVCCVRYVVLTTIINT